MLLGESDNKFSEKLDVLIVKHVQRACEMEMEEAIVMVIVRWVLSGDIIKPRLCEGGNNQKDLGAKLSDQDPSDRLISIDCL